MDLGAILGVVVGILVPTVGAIYGYGKLRQTVKDNTDEIDELKVRVAKAEDAAAQVGGLAQAIEHMGERFASEVKHLVDRIAINDDHVRTQLSDIKDQLRSQRAPRASR